MPRSAREGEERQALLDLAEARGVALSEARAARAVAAGRGAELRQRIERAHGISPGADQNAAGAIMMIEGSLLTIGLFGWLFARAAREGEERQALLDLAQARGIELSDARAARAVAAGRGAELRRRIERGSSAG